MPVSWTWGRCPGGLSLADAAKVTVFITAIGVGELSRPEVPHTDGRQFVFAAEVMGVTEGPELTSSYSQGGP